MENLSSWYSKFDLCLNFIAPYTKPHWPHSLVSTQCHLCGVTVYIYSGNTACLMGFHMEHRKFETNITHDPWFFLPVSKDTANQTDICLRLITHPAKCLPPFGDK